jgi:hypothetical protein
MPAAYFPSSQTTKVHPVPRNSREYRAAISFRLYEIPNGGRGGGLDPDHQGDGRECESAEFERADAHVRLIRHAVTGRHAIHLSVEPNRTRRVVCQ